MSLHRPRHNTPTPPVAYGWVLALAATLALAWLTATWLLD